MALPLKFRNEIARLRDAEQPLLDDLARAESGTWQPADRRQSLLVGPDPARYFRTQLARVQSDLLRYLRMEAEDKLREAKVSDVGFITGLDRAEGERILASTPKDLQKAVAEARNSLGRRKRVAELTQERERLAQSLATNHALAERLALLEAAEDRLTAVRAAMATVQARLEAIDAELAIILSTPTKAGKAKKRG